MGWPDSLPRLFSKSIQENLFRGPGDLSDLISLNIQRGRERGVPSYTTYRNTFCKITPIVNSFEDLKKAGITQKDIDNLKSQYQAVNDVDLFVGGMSAPAQRNAAIQQILIECCKTKSQGANEECKKKQANCLKRGKHELSVRLWFNFFILVDVFYSDSILWTNNRAK